MLELLIDYARKHLHTTPEPGFSAKDIRWAIDCDEQGNFLDIIELGDAGQKNNRGQSFSKCPHLSQGELKAEGVTKSHFLTDTAEVVALFTKNPEDQKTVAKHGYFKSLLKQASSAMPAIGMLVDQVLEPDVLERVRQQLAARKAKPTDRVTFRLANAYPVDSDQWHEWWRSFRSTLTTAKDKANSPGSMRCFASGELVEPARVNPKVRGLADVGGSISGDALIGFKPESSCSFGLEQAFNAAVSKDMATTYSEALNELIRKTGQRLGGTKIVHWFRGKEIGKDDDPFYWLEEGQQKKELSVQRRVLELLKAIQKGQRPELGDNYYYAITLSGAGGRIMVRDWMEGEFEALLANVRNWFDDLSIVHRDGQTLAPSPRFLAVPGATVHQLDELPNHFIATLWRVAVRGEAIPEAALAKAFGRVKAGILEDKPLNHAGLGLIKAYHVRKNRMKGGNPMAADVKPYLNENHPHPAYQCGRLMAVLAKLQRVALGDVGSGVVQRCYAAASSTPALILGRLVRNSQTHLNKLPPALARWYENLLADIWGRINDSVPSTLSLEEQTLFALGYYQQRAQIIPASPDKGNQTKELEDD